MGKIIKKQIKRSIPWLTMLCLISALVSGLVFNFNFIFDWSQSDNLSLKLNMPEAMADTATTTVTVLNAPPVITDGPVENPISSSTSPINEGNAMSFLATADDPEDDDYYLIVCTTDSVTASTTGGPPTCGATQLCVSASTADSVEATCTYNDVYLTSESQAWFAFVCDDHASEGICSPSGDQGAGDSGSPFYINHKPDFSEVTTTVNNQPPGGTFTITASTTDNDTVGGADLQHIAVCLTNSWATSTGCAFPLCTGTTTAPTDPFCSFATTTPARDGIWTYWAFVMDGHLLAATSSNPQTNTYTVTNVAPTVTNITLQNGNDIQLELKGVAEVQASTTFQVTDNNGCPDIVYATGTMYWATSTLDRDCATDDDNCYQMASTSCEIIAGSCTDWADASANYTCSTTIAFHAQPTDPSSNEPTTVWWGGAAAWDEATSSASTATTGVDVLTNTALEVTEPEIPYGSVASNDDTGAVNATTTVENYGNSPIDAQIDGIDMWRSGGGDIEVYYQKYGLNPFTYPSATYTLTSTTTPAIDIVAPKPTTSTLDVEDEVYWGIGIPVGKLSGEYYGTNTIAVIIDSDGW